MIFLNDSVQINEDTKLISFNQRMINCPEKFYEAKQERT